MPLLLLLGMHATQPPEALKETERAADARLQRLARLCSKQARPDHVYVRSRTRARSRDSDGELPASRYLHGHDHGAAERRHAYQHRRGRSGSDSEPRRGGRARWTFRPVLQRTAAVEVEPAYDDTARERLRVLSLQLTGLA